VDVSSDWQIYALCGDADNPDDWDMSSELNQKVRAVAMCRRCPVYADCLTDAQQKPPTGMIQAAFGWQGPSREPLDPISGKSLLKAQRPRRGVNSHGYSGYANGCRCDVCRQGKRDYVASRKTA
jgi:hypothetical protein